jgi:N6-L-threonylcarbamoyladenine synthase
MIILGIETSCDETAAAILDIDKKGNYKILSNIISSQIEIHRKYGGIVPEVAARKHVEMMLPVVEDCLEKAMVSSEEIDLIAVTRGPGLITSLLVGIETAKSLSFAWKKPLIGINHLAGHLYSCQLSVDGSTKLTMTALEEIKFPALCLIVSGGHTELVLMKSYSNYKVIGKTLDDAAGEAFDKTAKLLGLPYPGGPEISRLAKEGNPEAFNFPRPMLDSQNFNFSFSGLKTSVLYKIKDLKDKIKDPEIIKDLAASVEQAIVDVLIEKTVRAAKKYRVKTITIGGGVSANRKLRGLLEERVANELKKVKVLLPEVGLSTDNGLVIALAGYYGRIKNLESRIKNDGWKKIEVDPNLEL